MISAYKHANVLARIHTCGTHEEGLNNNILRYKTLTHTHTHTHTHQGAQMLTASAGMPIVLARSLSVHVPWSCHAVSSTCDSSSLCRLFACLCVCLFTRKRERERERERERPDNRHRDLSHGIVACFVCVWVIMGVCACISACACM
jgi:hypothetical protein